MATASDGDLFDNYEGAVIEQDLTSSDQDAGSIEWSRSGDFRTSSTRTPNSQSYLNSSIPGEDRHAAPNTIDESVWETISRDLSGVWVKLIQVLWPVDLLGGLSKRGDNVQSAERGEAAGLSSDPSNNTGKWANVDVVLQSRMHDNLRDWDLWGPLIFCLLLSLLLSITKSSDQKTAVFSGIFALIWIGEAVVTAQIRLIGGNISFFQSICVIGYTLFPLVIAAMLSAVHLPVIFRIPTYPILVLWSLAAGISILGGSGVVKNRVIIAVYPLFVFYVGLGFICFIS